MSNISSLPEFVKYSHCDAIFEILVIYTLSGSRTIHEILENVSLTSLQLLVGTMTAYNGKLLEKDVYEFDKKRMKF